jgi:hypothetical protein
VVALVAGAAAAASCDDAGTLVPIDAGSEATTPSDAEVPDVPPTDFDGEAVPPASVPTLYVVHASPDAPPLRFCLALGAAREGGVLLVGGSLAPTPLTPLEPGRAAPLDLRGLDLDGVVEVIALDATHPAVVASTASDGGPLVPCEGLVGDDGLGSTSDGGGVLRPGRDYWVVGAVPMAAPQPTTTRLAAITGCLAGDPDATLVCPRGYDASTSDLTLLTWALDTSTVVRAGAIGAQFVQASSEWEAFRAANAGTTMAGFVLPSDAAVAVPVAVDAGFGSLAPGTLATTTGVALDGAAAFGVELVATSGTLVPPSPFAWSLPQVQSTTWPAGTPEGGNVGPGAGFVFVLVGNPATPSPYVDPVDGGPSAVDAGGVLNGHYPHFLALPVGGH